MATVQNEEISQSPIILTSESELREEIKEAVQEECKSPSDQQKLESNDHKMSPIEDAFSPESKRLISQAEDAGNLDLRQNFIEAKLAKKKAEAERQMVLNRVQLLKAEGQRVIQPH